MTTAIAVYGAVLATIASVLELLRWRADRPNLTVAPALNVRRHGCALRITVTNQGRQPSTIREIAFEAQEPVPRPEAQLSDPSSPSTAPTFTASKRETLDRRPLRLRSISVSGQ